MLILARGPGVERGFLDACPALHGSPCRVLRSHQRREGGRVRRRLARPRRRTCPSPTWGRAHRSSPYADSEHVVERGRVVGIGDRPIPRSSDDDHAFDSAYVIAASSCGHNFTSPKLMLITLTCAVSTAQRTALAMSSVPDRADLAARVPVEVVDDHDLRNDLHARRGAGLDHRRGVSASARG